ncbi:unnamed protein product [Paramecium pentaurelia]|uniref:Uncharacterized protein n=1 Tax=Paramecium pentaurelia TaxID=43138 RepID=A0A8S1TQK2_9CILI|nr:unnamed protein product [Paramecium pentaurelia]
MMNCQFLIQKDHLQHIRIFKKRHNILKILKLNQINQCRSEQFKQEILFEYNILQQLKYLMRLLEQMLLKTIQEINDQRNRFSKENCETDEIKMLQQQKELIQAELKNLNLKDNQFSFVNEFQEKLHTLPIATLNQKNFLKKLKAFQNLLNILKNKSQNQKLYSFKRKTQLNAFGIYCITYIIL